MLNYHAIPIAVKSLLLEISPLLLETSYYLAGGTSVALRYGHRLSVDLDYFTEQPLEKEIILSLLAEKITTISDQSSGAMQLLMSGIKVEFYAMIILFLTKPTPLIRFACCRSKM